MLKKISNLKYSYVYLLFLVFISALVYNIYLLYGELNVINSDYSFISKRLFYILIVLLAISLLLIVGILSNGIYFFKQSKQRISKLKKRIILAFSISALLPTMLIAIFSVYFLNFGIETWFDRKISNILDQSIHVAESYASEHTIQLRESAISVSNTVNQAYYKLINNRQLFNQTLNEQAKLHSFDEAIIFQRKSNTVLAQTSLSFSLAFLSIAPELIEKANNGEIVNIKCDSSKIRVLIKLPDFDDTFLLIGRLVNPEIIHYIDKTDGALKEYNILKKHIIYMQIKFSVIFIIVSLVLLVSAIIWGRKFAEKMVQPVRELVKAAEKVKNGDLTAQVETEALNKDEIKVLSSAFNQMVRQLNFQQKELVVAQRALAWSDVARRVAHEIKNPLTPIQLSAERLERKFSKEVSDSESFKKYISNILKNSNDIKNIVSEFVEFARLPAPNFIHCEICGLIKDTLESRSLINPDINYTFNCNVDKYDLICDVSQINRVLVNLLLNAEEALHKCKNDHHIIIDLIVEVNKLEIIISDNGQGFSDELLKSAKDAYVTTKPNGSGLGLSIVNRIISDHFGELTIQNNQTGGGKIRMMFDTNLLKNKLKSQE